jgi:hypothetical protein
MTSNFPPPRHEIQIRTGHDENEGNLRLMCLLPIWQLDGSGGFRYGLQMAA